MADTTQIISNDIVQINATYTNTPVDAGLSGVCLITKGNDTSLKTYYSFNDVVSDYGANTYVSNFAKNYFNGGGPMFQIINYQQGDDDNNATEALRKYYECGSEFFTFLATDDVKQTAIDLANLVENQSQGFMFLNIPVQQAQQIDFSAYQQALSNNISTVLLSSATPANTNLADYQFASEVLAQYAIQTPNFPLQDIHDLPTTQPQSKFDFDNNTLQQYKKNGVITYAYRNGIPMLTGGYSPSGYQVSNIMTRDWLNYNIKKAVTNAIINNSISYDATGIGFITDQIKNILNEAVDNHYIEGYNVNEPNAQQITEAKKASGILDGLGFTWEPTNNITNVVFQENIQLPQLG